VVCSIHSRKFCSLFLNNSSDYVDFASRKPQKGTLSTIWFQLLSRHTAKHCFSTLFSIHQDWGVLHRLTAKAWIGYCLQSFLRVLYEWYQLTASRWSSSRNLWLDLGGGFESGQLCKPFSLNLAFKFKRFSQSSSNPTAFQLIWGCCLDLSWSLCCPSRLCPSHVPDFSSSHLSDCFRSWVGLCL